jgi:non-specific protein-tyrosine kinase
MFGVGLVIIFEAMDDSIKGPEEITRQLGLPVLGLIASHGVDGKKLITLSDPRSPVSEAFRSLRTNLKFTSVDRPLKSLLVTSPSSEDGKSTIASNLSVIMAQGGYRVLVVDADLRKPMIHNFFRIPNRTGLSGLFTESLISLNGSIHKTDVANLRVITTGNLPPNPSELLGSDKMTQILAQACNYADFVILDSPPVLVVTDSTVLAPKVDGILLVVKPGRSNLQDCKQAIEQLKMVGARIVGVVLNDIDIKRFGNRYGYNKSYYYYSDKKGDVDGSDQSPT